MIPKVKWQLQIWVSDTELWCLTARCPERQRVSFLFRRGNDASDFWVPQFCRVKRTVSEFWCWLSASYRFWVTPRFYSWLLFQDKWCINNIISPYCLLVFVLYFQGGKWHGELQKASKLWWLEGLTFSQATAEREFGPQEFKKGGRQDNQRFLVFLKDELCSFAFWKGVQTLKWMFWPNRGAKVWLCLFEQVWWMSVFKSLKTQTKKRKWRACLSEAHAMLYFPMTE